MCIRDRPLGLDRDEVAEHRNRAGQPAGGGGELIDRRGLRMRQEAAFSRVETRVASPVTQESVGSSRNGTSPVQCATVSSRTRTVATTETNTAATILNCSPIRACLLYTSRCV